jgi:hypothetical protein
MLSQNLAVAWLASIDAVIKPSSCPDLQGTVVDIEPKDSTVGSCELIVSLVSTVQLSCGTSLLSVLQGISTSSNATTMSSVVATVTSNQSGTVLGTNSTGTVITGFDSIASSIEAGLNAILIAQNLPTVQAGSLKSLDAAVAPSRLPAASSKSRSSTGMVAGITLGIIAIVLLAAAALLRRRRKAKRAENKLDKISRLPEAFVFSSPLADPRFQVAGPAGGGSPLQKASHQNALFSKVSAGSAPANHTVSHVPSVERGGNRRPMPIAFNSLDQKGQVEQKHSNFPSTNDNIGGKAPLRGALFRSALAPTSSTAHQPARAPIFSDDGLGGKSSLRGNAFRSTLAPTSPAANQPARTPIFSDDGLGGKSSLLRGTVFRSMLAPATAGASKTKNWDASKHADRTPGTRKRREFNPAMTRESDPDVSLPGHTNFSSFLSSNASRGMRANAAARSDTKAYNPNRTDRFVSMRITTPLGQPEKIAPSASNRHSARLKPEELADLRLNIEGPVSHLVTALSNPLFRK